MAKKIKLSKEMSDRLGVLASELQGEYDDQQEVFDSRSDSWRESDLGTAAEGWLEAMEELIEMLENFPDEPGEL